MNLYSMRAASAALAGIGLLCLSTLAHADSKSFASTNAVYTGPSTANGQKASATFSVTGSTLTIQLFNLSTGTPTTSADVLTGLFFTAANNNTGSAVSVTGSTIAGTPSPTTSGPGSFSNPLANNVGRRSGNFTFFDQGPVLSANVGIGASSFTAANNSFLQSKQSLFGQSSGTTTFANTSTNLGGADYGILKSGATVPFNNSSNYVNGSATFTFNVSNGFLASGITNVYFAFDGGDGPILNSAVVPEPMFVQMASLLMLGGVGSLVQRRRARRKSSVGSNA